MNASDYARAWGSQDASAYNMLLAPGASAAAGGARDRSAPSGRTRGSRCRARTAHTAQQSALSRQALARLTQIATLIPIVAVLAMAAAMGAMIWQRRPRLAKLKLEGLPRADLWRTILLESLLLARRRLPDRRGLRPVRPAAGRPRARRDDQLPRRLLGHGARRAVKPRARDAHGARDPRRSPATSPPPCRPRSRCRTEAPPPAGDATCASSAGSP